MFLVVESFMNSFAECLHVGASKAVKGEASLNLD